MEQRKATESNRIARDTDAWNRVEDKMAERYGRKIIYDRDFLKAKRDIYKHIRDKHKNKLLNLFEKADLRVLRGQHRNLLRQIYPNPFVRLTRNLLVFTGNVTGATLKAIIRAGTAFFSPKATTILPAGYTRFYAPDKKTVQYKSQENSKQHLPTNQTTAINTTTTKQKQQTQAVVSQAKAAVRKLPVKSRVQMPSLQGKGIRR